MSSKTLVALGCASVLISLPVQAETAVEQLLANYREQGVAQFNAANGETFWNQDIDGRSCTSCHGADLLGTGQHIKTKKLIEPMAPSVNPERLTQVSKIEKWFLRNCKWTLERECTAQEKGDVLIWLVTQ